MALNWVMLGTTTHSFIPLPHEETLYTSPARTSLSLTAPSGGFNISSSAGVAYLTSQRLVYIPTTPSSGFESFSAPITHLQDSRVVAPFFGANSWEAAVMPVIGGGFPAAGAELKLVFKDGGAFDFHTLFERVKEQTLLQREAGGGEVIVEDLPAYDGAPAYDDGNSTLPPPPPQPQGGGPSEAPPGYEEVQAQSVFDKLGKKD